MIAHPLKQVIVFGASGFIGGGIYRHLQQTKSFDLVGYSSVECNLLDHHRVVKVLNSCGPETSAVLCSAITRRVEDSWDAMLKNITMIHHLTSSIPRSGLRSIIFMSSVDVYGIPETSPISEDTTLNPNGYYGLSKLICEVLLRFEPISKGSVTILRLPGIYGPGDRFQSVIGKVIRQVLHQERIEIRGDGTAKRDYVAVTDLCQVVEHFLGQPFTGVVNVATGENITIKDLISTVGTEIGITPIVQFLPDTSIPSDLVFNTGRLKSLCPNCQFIDFQQGIAEYISHLRTSSVGPGERVGVVLRDDHD